MSSDNLRCNAVARLGKCIEVLKYYPEVNKMREDGGQAIHCLENEILPQLRELSKPFISLEAWIKKVAKGLYDCGTQLPEGQPVERWEELLKELLSAPENRIVETVPVTLGSGGPVIGFADISSDGKGTLQINQDSVAKIEELLKPRN